MSKVLKVQKSYTPGGLESLEGVSIGGTTQVSPFQDVNNDDLKEALDKKLDKTAQAVDSALLEGHNADYFLPKTGKAADSNLLDGLDGTQYARLANENTFQKRQTFLDGIDVLGTMNVRNTEDVNIYDNLIELNKGETHAGVAVRWAGISIDRGTLPNTAIVYDEGLKSFRAGLFNSENGKVGTVSGQNIELVGGTTDPVDFVGKLLKLFHPPHDNKVVTITSYDPGTKIATVTGKIDGVDNSWTWRVLTDNDLHTIPTIEDNLVNGNGVVWNGERFTDAGYKWALKNGDSNQLFKASGLSVGGTAHIDRLRIIGQAINSYTSDFYINNRNGDQSTTNFRDFYIQDGKRNHIVKFEGSTKESKFFGDIQANQSIHSKDYVSGITGKGWRITQDADAEFTNLSIRDSLTVNTLVNNKINVQNGDLIVSDSAKIAVIMDVQHVAFKEQHPFQVGDYLRCSKNIGETYYLRVQSTGHNASGYWIGFGKTGTGTVEVDDLLVRWNSTVSSRQGLLYLSGLNEYLDVVHNQNTKVRLGNLTGINDSTFGQLQGYGLYADNVYLKGIMQLAAGSSISWNDVTGAQDQINAVNQTFDTFNQSLNSVSHTANNAQQTANNADSKIDGLDLGERNLLLDSGRVITNNHYNIANYYFSEAPKDGEEVTFVLKGKLGAGKQLLWFYNSGGNVRLAEASITTNDTHIYKVTFNWRIVDSDNTHVSVYMYPSGSTATSTIEWIKLVRGNKTSLDWTPAPEDAAIYSKVGGTTLITNNKIRTSLLEASEIQANIINTTYLNGLSLNFTKGHIGGWNISDRQLSSNNVFIDALGGQIYGGGTASHRGFHFRGNGSGYLANNNISWDTAGNLTMIGKITSSSGNIAGWTINSDYLLGGNTTLYNSGTIVNGTISQANWLLNSDGSGKLAHGNISWDTIGNTTFKGDIVGSNISGTNIDGATISGGNIIGTNIQGTTITGGTINGIKIHRGQFYSHTDGDQEVIFDEAFESICLGVMVTMQNQAMYVRYVRKDKFTINRYDNLSNSYAYYVAFGY